MCDALLAALRRHGIPEQIFTDNGKVFTGRFGPAGSSAEVLFDRVCAENGIRHLLTAPRSPTTTGKVERWHKTIRAEFLRVHDRRHATLEELQAALDVWVEEYNTLRPHQALGMRPPIERFQLAAGPGVETVVEPGAVPAVPPAPVVEPSPQIVRLPGVQRWVDQHGLISLGGFRYRVPIVLAGEPVEAVAAEHLVRIFHRDVLVAEHVQRRKPDTGDRSRRSGCGRAAAGPGAPPTGWLSPGWWTPPAMSRSPAPTIGSATAGAAAAPRCASSPVRSSCLATARSSGCTRSGTTGPRSMARSPPRTGGPATDRMRRPEPASRPRRCAVGLPAEP